MNRTPEVAFVDLARDFYDKHWVYSLAGCLRAKGIRAHYVSAANEASGLARLAQVKPEIVLYSAYSFNLPHILAFDERLKRTLPVTSIMGGPGPTFDLEAARSGTIDALCIGEGELALIEFIESGCTTARNMLTPGQDATPQLAPFVELDALPMPDRDLVYMRDAVVRLQPSKQFLSGRGCPYHCTYCFNHAYNRMFKGCGPIVRKKSVDYLLEEIEEVQQRYALATVVFQDDTFIADSRWFLTFCERFPARIGLPYTCNVRANLMHRDIAQALRDSGCTAVQWSIESGDDHLRNDVLRRNITREQIVETAHLLSEHGIRFRVGNLIGLPGETASQREATIRLNAEIRPTLGLANIFVPFPSLALTEHALEHGHLSGESLSALPRDFFTRSILNFSDKEQRELRKLVCLFPLFVRYPWLHERAGIRRFLLRMPRLVLRAAYELFYVRMFAKLYRVKTPFATRLRMLGRYISNLDLR